MNFIAGLLVQSDHDVVLGSNYEEDGACTFVTAPFARSGRPPRETTAPISSGISAAATSAAAAPVLEPK
jgi:hypothetical protein